MANIVPAQSAEFEGSGTGDLAAWFGCTIAKSTVTANNGTGSLEVAATGASVGVQNNNYPGTAGVVAGTEYALSWAANGPAAAWTADVRWRDDGGTELGTVSLPLTTAGAGTWVGSEVVLATAPAGTTRFYYEITTGEAAANELHYFDSFVIDDEPSTGLSVALTGTLAALSGSLTVEREAATQLAGTLPPLSGSLTAEVQASAQLAGSLPALAGSLDAEAVAAASFTGTLPALSGQLSLALTAETDAALSGTLPALSGTLTAEVEVSGSLAGTLPALAGSLSAEAVVATALAGTLPALSGSLVIEEAVAVDLSKMLLEGTLIVDRFESPLSVDGYVGTAVIDTYIGTAVLDRSTATLRIDMGASNLLIDAYSAEAEVDDYTGFVDILSTPP